MPYMLVVTGGHYTGGVVMGDDPETSVVKPFSNTLWQSEMYNVLIK